MPRKPLAFCGILLGLAVLGCGQDEKLTPVHGQVFHHGQPLAGGTIVFAPDAERGGHGPLAFGEVGPDGRYTLPTGVVPGWHRITIAPPPNFDLPRKYSDPAQSGLLREIKAGSVEQDFHLE